MLEIVKYSTILPRKQYQTLKNSADRRGVGVSVMSRIWLMEKIKEVEGAESATSSTDQANPHNITQHRSVARE